MGPRRVAPGSMACHNVGVPRHDELRATLIELMGTRTIPRDELYDLVAGASAAGGSHPGRSGLVDDIDDLLQFDTCFSGLRGGVAFTPAVLEGTRWTVPIDPANAGEDFVVVHPNLDPFGWWLVHQGIDLADADGSVVAPLQSDAIWDDGVDTDIMVGPPGWLAEIGSLAEFSVIDGRLRCRALTAPPAPTARQVAALLAGFDAAVQQRIEEGFGAASEHALSESVINEALCVDREAFLVAPVPLIDDLHRACGLEMRRHTVARTGFDWDELDAERALRRTMHLYDLDDAEAQLFQLLWGASRLVIDGDVDALGTDDEERTNAAALLGACLAEPAVARALWQRHIDDEQPVEALGRFVDELRLRLGDADFFDGLDWLQARVLDHLGDTDRAVALVEAACDRGSDHPLLLAEAAAHAADAGEAAAALLLLRRAGITDEVDPEAFPSMPSNEVMLLWEVESFARPPRPLVGRNDRCPCGSGRKYKVCHLGKEELPLAERAPWLYQKAMRFLRERAPTATLQLTDAVVDEETDFLTHDQLSKAPFITDLALHHGMFEQFVAARSHRLPADEALLAAQWELTSASVFEVVSARGTSIDVRDIASGDVVTVSGVTADVPVGTTLYGRPLPVGDTHRPFPGWVPVSRALVDSVLAAIDTEDPFEVARALAPVFAPPKLTNTDGHMMEAHSPRWRLPVGCDASTVGAALESVGFGSSASGASADEIDELSWVLTAPGQIGPTVISQLFLRSDCPDELVGDANSAERAEALIDLVAAALPDAELIDHEVQTLADLARAYDPERVSSELDVTDPQVAEMLTNFMHSMEERWIDESIPALGGRTPRDAITDPIGREQVEQLLASVPIIDDPGAMSPVRLRALLGLPEPPAM
jgi:hypothetical protein